MSHVFDVDRHRFKINDLELDGVFRAMLTLEEPTPVLSLVSDSHLVRTAGTHLVLYLLEKSKSVEFFARVWQLALKNKGPLLWGRVDDPTNPGWIMELRRGILIYSEAIPYRPPKNLPWPPGSYEPPSNAEKPHYVQEVRIAFETIFTYAPEWPTPVDRAVSP